mmetsp:Transcript_20230/g.55832  ORF Transcript_20230/g.55832 Transcript_20230/m.55832 type:complete len:231 (-) Transcript_20230:716-1408(-)
MASRHRICVGTPDVEALWRRELPCGWSGREAGRASSPRRLWYCGRELGACPAFGGWCMLVPGLARVLGSLPCSVAGLVCLQRAGHGAKIGKVGVTDFKILEAMVRVLAILEDRSLLGGVCREDTEVAHDVLAAHVVRHPARLRRLNFAFRPLKMLEGVKAASVLGCARGAKRVSVRAVTLLKDALLGVALAGRVRPLVFTSSVVAVKRLEPNVRLLQTLFHLRLHDRIVG